jgi:tetratricopeptide (TPR) repeat protein
MNPAMMNPEMMKAAQDMMSKMSPEDMQKMQKMQQEMMKNPAMMQQAQQMMSNPAMAQQAAAQMKNMSSDDVRKQMDQAGSMLGSGAGLPGSPAPAPAKTVVERLKESAMSVPDDIVETVEEAENAKLLGNKRFKAQDWKGAAGKYTQGAAAVDKALAGGSLSGADKKAVCELKEACHLNLANCRLKLCEWDAAISECDTVLKSGENRKARFRRGDALRELGRLEDARDDMAKAVKMDPSDTVVLGKLKAIKAQLGEEDDDPLVEDVEEVDTSTGSSGGGSSSSRAPAMPAMPGAPGGPPMPDPEQMEKMLDQITPEQMEQQMNMLDSMSPEALKAMGMPEGVDASQLKMMKDMMKGMDKDSMKGMAKMAAQMRPQMEAMRAGASGSGGGGGSSSAAGGASGLPAGMPDMDNMSLDGGVDMLKNMNPDMMKAGMDMMKNMDPKMMKQMSKMMGREIDEGQMEQMQNMMSNMSPEDMQKWAGRAQKMAGFASKPLGAYRACRAWAAKLGAVGALGVLGGLLGVLWIGHVTDTF